MRISSAALWVIFSFIILIVPAHAQIVGIAVVVNEEVISALDVENRLRFNLMSANLTDNKQNRRRLKPQVLLTLVDEKLQMQEAKRLNISINDSEISDTERILEAQNNLPTGSLKNFLKSRGLDKSTLMTKIQAEIAWGKVLRRQVFSRIDISDEEIDEVLDRFQSRRGTEQRLVSEIFLAVDSLDQTENVHQLALRLVRQIREGSRFAVVAQQFSQGVTSRTGGDIGWVGEGELATELEQALAELSAGKVSNPISSLGGYYILFLRDKRRLGEANPLDARVNLKQIFIPIPDTTPEKIASARIAEANRISEQIIGCETFDVYGRTMEVGESGDLGTVRMGDVPQNVRDAIKSLMIGQASIPMKIGQGIRILMVCDRQEPVATLPNRSAIRDRIGRQRLAMMSRRYLRDLRHNAVIETR